MSEFHKGLKDNWHIVSIGDSFYYPDSTDGDIEAQRGSVICPG